MAKIETCKGCGEELSAALMTDGGICVACADEFETEYSDEG